MQSAFVPCSGTSTLGPGCSQLHRAGCVKLPRITRRPHTPHCSAPSVACCGDWLFHGSVRKSGNLEAPTGLAGCHGQRPEVATAVRPAAQSGNKAQPTRARQPQFSNSVPALVHRQAQRQDMGGSGEENTGYSGNRFCK